MRIKPGGVSQYWGPHGLVEVHASTCFHCQVITDIPDMKRLQQYVHLCRTCMHLICLECAKTGVCDPMIKKIEEAEEREYRLRQMVKS